MPEQQSHRFFSAGKRCRSCRVKEKFRCGPKLQAKRLLMTPYTGPIHRAQPQNPTRSISNSSC